MGKREEYRSEVGEVGEVEDMGGLMEVVGEDVGDEDGVSGARRIGRRKGKVAVGGQRKKGEKVKVNQMRSSPSSLSNQKLTLNFQ